MKADTPYKFKVKVDYSIVAHIHSGIIPLRRDELGNLSCMDECGECHSNEVREE